jgi:divalent metal cation (Fe/Co/Zn/Cd) transporter
MDRPRLLRQALVLSLITIMLNGLFGGTAVTVGVHSHSLALLGFGLDAAIDSVASMVLVWRFRTEVREPHRAERIERLAELTVGSVLLLLAIYLAVGAANAIAMATRPDPGVVRTVLLALAVIILPPLGVAKLRVARALGSGALRADSILTGIAALLGVIGLASLVADQVFRVAWADAVGALVISAIIAREGWSSIQSARTVEPILPR